MKFVPGKLYCNRYSVIHGPVRVPVIANMVQRSERTCLIQDYRESKDFWIKELVVGKNHIETKTVIYDRILLFVQEARLKVDNLPYTDFFYALQFLYKNKIMILQNIGDFLIEVK